MIRVIRDRCQPLRYAKAECRLCVEACPVEGCLGFDGGTLRIDTASCAGCGACAAACPSGALELKGLDDGELLARLKDGPVKEGLFIGCYLGPEPEGGCTFDAGASGSGFVRVPCLAALKESHLVSLLASGAGRVDIDLSRCGQCALGRAAGVVRKTVRHAESLLARMLIPGRVNPERINVLERLEALPGGFNSAFGVFRKKRVPRDITPGPELTRRELFGIFRAMVTETADGGVSAEASFAEEASQKRLILLEALRGGDVGVSGALKDGEFPVRQIGIDSSCVMCRRCEAFCPTGALKRVDGAGGASIEFRSALCAGCYQCREFCPAEAVYYEEEVGLEGLRDDTARVLMKKETVNCPRCSRPYVPELEKNGCPACRKKKRLDESILSIIFSDTGGGKRTDKEAI